MNNHNQNWIFLIKHVVFSGGAQKGNAFLGAWNILLKSWTMSQQKKGLYEQIEGYGGSSIGALMALACSINMPIESIQRFFIEEGDTSELLKKSLGHLPDAYQDCGIMPSNYIGQKVCKLLNIGLDIGLRTSNNNTADKITFKELHEMTHKMLKIVTANLSQAHVEIFDYETTPEMRVVDAVTMSMTIPFLMKPFIYKNQCYVDGGLYDNYPVTMFPPDELLGFRLCGKRSLPEKFNFHEYASVIAASTMYFYEEKIMNLLDAEYRTRTVDIYFPPISLIELINADKKTRESYIKLGEGSMTAFLFQNVFINDLLVRFLASINHVSED
jgi:hypothetical protein